MASVNTGQRPGRASPPPLRALLSDPASKPSIVVHMPDASSQVIAPQPTPHPRADATKASKAAPPARTGAQRPTQASFSNGNQRPGHRNDVTHQYSSGVFIGRYWR